MEPRVGAGESRRGGAGGLRRRSGRSHRTAGGGGGGGCARITWSRSPPGQLPCPLPSTATGKRCAAPRLCRARPAGAACTRCSRCGPASATACSPGRRGEGRTLSSAMELNAGKSRREAGGGRDACLCVHLAWGCWDPARGLPARRTPPSHGPAARATCTVCLRSAARALVGCAGE